MRKAQIFAETTLAAPLPMRLASDAPMRLASDAQGTMGVRAAVLKVDRAVGLQSELPPNIGAAAAAA